MMQNKMNSRVWKLTPDLVSWAYPKTETTRFSYIWTIDNYSGHPKGVGKVLSTEFSTEVEGDSYNWRLYLHLGGNSEKNKDYLSLYIVLDSSSSKGGVSANCKFSFVGDRNQVNSREFCDFFACNESWGFTRFTTHQFLKDHQDDLLAEDKLVISCVLTLYGHIITDSGINYETLECVADDLEYLFENRKFADLTITTAGEQKLQVHKLILAARSSVFEAMLEHDLKENKTSEINITDVKDNVLCEMLKFIYTGKVSDLENMAEDLLKAADKYKLQELKKMCEEALCRKLTAENVADRLILADRHSAIELKKKVLEFFTMHAEEVLCSETRKDMLRSYPDLLLEVLIALAKTK